MLHGQNPTQLLTGATIADPIDLITSKYIRKMIKLLNNDHTYSATVYLIEAFNSLEQQDQYFNEVVTDHSRIYKLREILPRAKVIYDNDILGLPSDNHDVYARAYSKFDPEKPDIKVDAIASIMYSQIITEQIRKDEWKQFAEYTEIYERLYVRLMKLLDQAKPTFIYFIK